MLPGGNRQQEPVSRSAPAANRRVENYRSRLMRVGCGFVLGYRLVDVYKRQAEFYALLNKVRWYSVYVCKSRSPWVGNQAFVCDLRESAGRYRDELRAYYSRARMLLLELDRYRAMRPVVVMLTTGLRWRTSLRRRLALSLIHI